MNSNSKNLHLGCKVWIFNLLLLGSSFALNHDGILLLSFKYSILSDPLSVLENWSYSDETPCSWNGVTCTQIGTMYRVTSLVLPNSQLLGSISEDVGMIQHLRILNLSNNFLNGSLPNSIFLNSSELHVLSLSNNVISGEISESIGESKSLQLLNLSDNAFAGSLLKSLINLKNLTFVSLRSNYFSGKIPIFDSVLLETLDLSSNLFNESLPENFGGDGLKYLNFSYNKITGTIPPEFAKKLPENSIIDLSFNNLTGPIPFSLALLSQKTESFSGNPDLCGKPLKILCSIPSSLSNPPNSSSSSSSSPAIAAIPKTIDTNPKTNGTHKNPKNGLKPSTIAGIVTGDLAGIAILTIIILLIYQNRKQTHPKTKQDAETKNPKSEIPCFFGSLAKTEEKSSSSSSESDGEEKKKSGVEMMKEGKVVTVDGETELEAETLLRAAAYVVGTKGGSIVYRAEVEDGRVYAVRRIGIGECVVERMKEFERRVRSIAKIRHRNLVRVRGFCWGEDEKLVICDFVANGSLANMSHRRTGSSSSSSSSPMNNMSLEVRVKIARGVARGLAFLHDKKHVHGNLKPSNILLSSDMEPLISDFGLRRLLLSTTHHHTPNNSFRQQDDGGTHNNTNTPGGTHSPYQAPEWFQHINPTPKCDVYSYGVVLLELLTGRLVSDLELAVTEDADVAEERQRALRMADVAIRCECADVEHKEDVVLRCFKLGFSCVSHVPHKRPSMKEALQILEKIPC